MQKYEFTRKLLLHIVKLLLHMTNVYRYICSPLIFRYFTLFRVIINPVWIFFRLKPHHAISFTLPK